MGNTRRKFTSEERLLVLQEVRQVGLIETCRKRGLSPSLVSKWKQRYLEKGVDGLKTQYNRVDPELRSLQEENERLKRIIARQALEIEVKGELLKKTPIQTKRRKL